jgi:copper chaperone NosL
MKLQPKTRWTVAICSLIMCYAYFASVWKIELEAPQYPEGLGLQIWVNGLKGDVDSVNNLNHYIGMAHLTNNIFWEFKVLPYLLALIIISGLVVSLLNSKKILGIYVGFLVLVAALASYDFWHWEYQYGHNLDPRAAISIPGMSYQPPFLGYKQLLNFLAGSLPDTGGYAIIIPGAIIAMMFIYEQYLLKINKV